ncbi:Choline dehydrogenase [Variovorax sp. HW608]|uniref:family 16 glycoside hydrolase n=1 Tax=Variovorax sp. HW608 TaxID=1034889 RepID=UPI00081FB77E|nr:family 16 glycoside hydrolase [Variovorax sp. HW608]SCK27585.1 Choline dehydrogenase [Variovorax sp. HW608]
MINQLVEANQQVRLQGTTFSIDVLGRYVCSTWDEATANGGVAFDAVVIGAGMYGAYCAEKIYRLGPNLRVLVLDAGSLLVTEHVQNLSRIGLNAAAPVSVIQNVDDPGTRELVWGTPWRSMVAFPGLAYCPGGRSLYWGGWSPRLTDADLANWPQPVATQLQSPTHSGDAYERVEKETGVFDKTDYISGPLFDALKKKFMSAAAGVATVDGIEDAPLAVQAAPPASGLFSFDKWSSMPILTDAVREAAGRPDWQRRLFIVPKAHVTKLQTAGGAVTAIDVRVNGQLKSIGIPPTCVVVLASGTIEATRLALESFPTPLMGRNLMAHLRSNTVVRIHRSVIDPALPERLEAAALLVRGSTPKGRYHLQVTAAAVAGGSEDDMFRMIPDIDLLDQTLAAQQEDWIVITLRGIAEMNGDRSANANKQTGRSPSWVDLSDQTDEFGMRRAWVNLATNQDDNGLWDIMDKAALDLANAVANNDPAKIKVVGQARDGLGTTHHEAGTLWMGANPNDSVTNLDGRFHHISNAYVAGPALFPTLGSANPSLTATALARRTAEAIVRESLGAEPGFSPLGTGGIAGWKTAGSGGFVELGGNIIESFGGIGLLWFTERQFKNFVLRVDWRASAVDDNSGIFIRFPDPGTDWTIPVAQGYEIQIDNTGKNPDTNPPTFGDPLHNTGAVYGLAASTSAPTAGQWHTYEIEANGSTITVWLDGQQVSQLQNANRSPQGFIGLQNHHAGSRVQFTRLRIKQLP